MLHEKCLTLAGLPPSARGELRANPHSRAELKGYLAAVQGWSYRLLLFTVLIPAGARLVCGQAAVEYGGAISKSGITAVQAPKVTPDLTKAANVAHLPSRTGEPAEDLNRRALESHAGKNAAKLMLRSTPSKASVRIEGKLVGKTPLLLVLAPGAYNVTVDGERMSSAQKQVDLLPHETREIVLPLESRYPAHVQLR